jgi:hypothetical protein
MYGEFPFPETGGCLNQSYWYILDFPPALSVTIGQTAWKLLEVVLQLLNALCETESAISTESGVTDRRVKIV